MATFAPVLPPTNDPNYLNYSKPISDIQVDKTTGKILTSIGETIEGVATVGDRIVKEFINEDVRKGVDKQRDAFTSSLVAFADQQSGAGVIPSPEGQAQAGVKAPLSLAPGEEENVPAGVKAGVQRAQSIGSAMTQNSGKSNDTLYTGALTALTKDLRNRYPGYRDYIDEKISAVSGINPANAYMRNLLEDINRNATSGKAEVDKAVALGRQYLGYDPNMPAYIEAVRQNLPNAVQNLEGRINQVAGDKIKFDELERTRKLRDFQREDATTEQTHEFATEIRSKGHLLWNGVVEIPGLNNPSTIQNLIDDQRAGRIKLTDEQNTALLSAATLARDTWQRQSVEIMRNRGYTQSIPKKEDRDKIIEDEGRFFNDQIEAIKNKEYGTMFGNERRNKSIQSDTQQNLLSDRDMGAYWRFIGGAKNIAGDAMVNFVQAEALKSGVTGAVKNFLQDEKLKMLSPYDPRFPNETRSIYDAVKKAQEAKIAPTSKTYDDLVGNVKIIAMETPPPGVSAEQFAAAKREIVNYMFNPQKNEKLLDRFSKSFTDSDGVYHPGKEALYDTMTQRGIVDKIWDSRDAQSWGKFKEWNELSFRKLFGEQVGDLQRFAETSKSVQLKIFWDSDAKQFRTDVSLAPLKMDPRTPEIARPSEAARQAGLENYKRTIDNTVTQLNKGLSNLSYMKDKEGTDTSAYLMNIMMGLGLRPNEKLSGSLPQQVIDAIANSKKQNRINEAFEAAGGKQ